MSQYGWVVDVTQRLLRERGLVRPRDLKAEHISAAWVPYLRSDRVIVVQPPGVYADPHALYPPEICAAVKWPNAVLMGPSALTARGRWRELEVPWLAIGHGAHRPRPINRVEFIRTRGLAADPDVERITVRKTSVIAFSVERALFDCLRLLERFPVEDLVPALRNAITDGSATTAGLQRRAKERACWPDVRAALHVLLDGPVPAATPWTELRSIIPLDDTPTPGLEQTWSPPRILVERRPPGSVWDASSMRGVRRPPFAPLPAGPAPLASWEAPVSPRGSPR